MIAHFVGSLPLADAESAFRVVSEALGPYVKRLPDGETGIRQSWIRFLQDVLAAHPAVRVADDLPPFRFVQWDGRLVREIPRLRIVNLDRLDASGFMTGYADMAIASWDTFSRLRREGAIGADVRFQISLPTPTAPTYNNMQPSDRPQMLTALTEHFAAEVAQIARALPHEDIAIQWDVCQEVLAWEGYYEPGPVDFESETADVLATVCDTVPDDIETGIHLCYGSPLDEHLVQPKDMGVLVAIANALLDRVTRDVTFIHFPVPRSRVDEAYFVPLAELELTGTELYFGLIHANDSAGNIMRFERARALTRVDGVATECGLGRGDASKLAKMLAAHRELCEYAS